MLVETDDGYDYPSAVDVDFRFFDPDRDIDLVRWYADMITCAGPEDDSNDEDEDDEDDGLTEDIMMYCTRPV